MPINSRTEIEKVLEKHKLPKPIQETMNNLNSPIPVREIETIANSHLTRKSPVPESFNGEFF